MNWSTKGSKAAFHIRGRKSDVAFGMFTTLVFRERIIRLNGRPANGSSMENSCLASIASTFTESWELSPKPFNEESGVGILPAMIPTHCASICGERQHINKLEAYPTFVERYWD